MLHFCLPDGERRGASAHKKGGSMVLHVNSENWKELVEDSNLPVLVDFAATWCGPCRMMAPVLEEIATEHPEIKVAKIDVDESPELADMFRISVVPTFIAIVGGEERGRFSGTASKNLLLDKLPALRG